MIIYVNLRETDFREFSVIFVKIVKVVEFWVR